MIPSSVADPNCRLLGYVMPNPSFHMPESVSMPIIMIGVGSGIAPFRAFWQHRLAQMKVSLNQLRARRLDVRVLILGEVYAFRFQYVFFETELVKQAMNTGVVEEGRNGRSSRQ
jgi:hypothetical protein